MGVMLRRSAEMALPMRALRMVAAALAVTLLVACQPAGTPMTLDGVTLLRYGPGVGARTALYEGTLRFRDGCIWVESPQGTGAVVLWPSDARLELVDGNVHVIVGQVSMTEGDPVQLGGGQYLREELADVERLVGPVPASCVADMYWMAGLVNKRSSS